MWSTWCVTGCTDAVAHFAEHDELYWNATGNEWQSSIGAATTRVHLPGAVAREDLEVVAYTGAFGSREQEAVVEIVSESEIAYTASQPLGPLHGLTVVAAWPHGLVSFPGPLARGARFVGANWVILFPFLAAALLFWRYWTGGATRADPRA